MITIILNETPFELKTYPTVGQLIEMKRLEMNLSGNRLEHLISSSLIEDGEIALDIKAVAAISVLFPKVKEQLKCDSLLQLQYDDWLEVLEQYSTVVLPWLVNWKKSLKKLDVEEILKSEDEQNA